MSLRARLKGPGTTRPGSSLRALRRDLLAVEIGERGTTASDVDYQRFHTSRYASGVGRMRRRKPPNHRLGT